MHGLSIRRPITLQSADALPFNQTSHNLAISRLGNLQSAAYRTYNGTVSEPLFYRRYADRLLTEALEDSPAVLIHGPRQCGKTTLAQVVCAPKQARWEGKLITWEGGPVTQGTEYAYISFDDDVVRGGAEADPMGFVSALPERVILDEVQRVPRLFAALKLDIDRRRVPGRFVLTGSSNALRVPTLADSLAGRLQIVRLHPLAQCELESRSGGSSAQDTMPGFLDTLFGGDFKAQGIDRLGEELGERIAAGGFPAALARPAGRRRATWYRDYVQAQLEKDVRDMARITMLDALPRLLALAAAQTANLLNVSNLASAFSLSRPSVSGYLGLLERVFLLELLQPWHSNRLSRLVKTPKLHIGDTGLACALLGLNARGLAKNRALMGHLLESFVFQELRRQASWHNAHLDFFHYRDKDKAEVDIVIERGALSLAGVEVKASGTVTKTDFRGLRRLRQAAGDRFAAGVVLYDGEACTSFGDRLYAVPLRTLWEISA